MTLHRIVPIADVEVAARTETDIDGNEAEVRREDEIKDKLLGVVVVLSDPFVELDLVRRLVSRLDEPALHLFRPEREIDEVVAAGAGIGGQPGPGRMLLGIGRIGGWKALAKIGWLAT